MRSDLLVGGAFEFTPQLLAVGEVTLARQPIQKGFSGRGFG